MSDSDPELSGEEEEELDDNCYDESEGSDEEAGAGAGAVAGGIRNRSNTLTVERLKAKAQEAFEASKESSSAVDCGGSNDMKREGVSKGEGAVNDSESVEGKLLDQCYSI